MFRLHRVDADARARGAQAIQDRAESGPAPKDLLERGVVFARYEISHRIGQGGMGAVYEARHTVLNKRVALKTLHRTGALDPQLRRRFLREAELAARVRHPNVVEIHDAGVENNIPFLVMELLEGYTLADHLVHEGRCLVRQLIDVAIPVIAGLSELHRQRIAHRDVKPENIFLAFDSRGNHAVKLIDFGISKNFEQAPPGHVSQVREVPDSRVAQRAVEGTPCYMAPEQLRGEAELDARSDQYALGVVLYQCLSGTLPYQGASLLELAYQVCHGSLVSLERLRPDLPRELLVAIERAMARDLEQRYASIDELGRALLPFASPDARPFHELLLSRGVSASAPGSEPFWVPPAARHAHDDQGSVDDVPTVPLDRDTRPAPAGGLSRRYGGVLAWLRRLLFTSLQLTP